MKPELFIQQDTAVLSGEMTIRFAEAIRMLLVDVNKSTATSLLVKAPTTIDLSVVQLIWSLRTTRIRDSRPLELSFELNDSDEKLLERCGLKNIFDNNKSK